MIDDEPQVLTSEQRALLDRIVGPRLHYPRWPWTLDEDALARLMTAVHEAALDR